MEAIGEANENKGLAEEIANGLPKGLQVPPKWGDIQPAIDGYHGGYRGGHRRAFRLEAGRTREGAAALVCGAQAPFDAGTDNESDLTR